MPAHSSAKKVNKSSGLSQRQLRVGESLRHILSHLIYQNPGWDSQLFGLSITVTEVRMSSDLRYATVFVMSLGGLKNGLVLEGLQRATPYFQKLLARQLSLKFVPQLRFRLDSSLDEVQKIEMLLGQPKVKQDLLSKDSGMPKDSGKDAVGS